MKSKWKLLLEGASSITLFPRMRTRKILSDTEALKSDQKAIDKDMRIIMGDTKDLQ